MSEATTPTKAVGKRERAKRLAEAFGSKGGAAKAWARQKLGQEAPRPAPAPAPVSSPKVEAPKAPRVEAPKAPPKEAPKTAATPAPTPKAAEAPKPKATGNYHEAAKRALELGRNANDLHSGKTKRVGAHMYHASAEAHRQAADLAPTPEKRAEHLSAAEAHQKIAGDPNSAKGRTNALEHAKYQYATALAQHHRGLGTHTPEKHQANLQDLATKYTAAMKAYELSGEGRAKGFDASKAKNPYIKEAREHAIEHGLAKPTAREKSSKKVQDALVNATMEAEKASHYALSTPARGSTGSNKTAAEYNSEAHANAVTKHAKAAELHRKFGDPKVGEMHEKKAHEHVTEASKLHSRGGEQAKRNLAEHLPSSKPAPTPAAPKIESPKARPRDPRVPPYMSAAARNASFEKASDHPTPKNPMEHVGQLTKEASTYERAAKWAEGRGDDPSIVRGLRASADSLKRRADAVKSESKASGTWDESKVSRDEGGRFT